ncbi:MAG: hypothetical protein E6G08_21015 [Actinobacteria bacterium]|nr:MAG: hypothetical protein E6G08_21015 [Actinomycetota bacterium]
MQYRRVGKWGLKLPEISLGLWHNFGGTAPLERSREILAPGRRTTTRWNAYPAGTSGASISCSP